MPITCLFLPEIVDFQEEIMATILAEPRRPADHWKVRVEEWVENVREVLNRAAAWARKRNWGVQEDAKTVTEESLGTLSGAGAPDPDVAGAGAPRPRGSQHRGAEGRIDFCVFPSYDEMNRACAAIETTPAKLAKALESFR